MKRGFLNIAMIAAFTLVSVSLFGQPGEPPGGGGGGEPVGGAAGAPLDGGAIALLAGGAALVYRKYIHKNKVK